MEDQVITLNDKSVESWAKILRCDCNDLWHAILTVGPSVKCVQAFLEMNGKIREEEDLD